METRNPRIESMIVSIHIGQKQMQSVFLIFVWEDQIFKSKSRERKKRIGTMRKTGEEMRNASQLLKL